MFNLIWEGINVTPMCLRSSVCLAALPSVCGHQTTTTTSSFSFLLSPFSFLLSLSLSLSHFIKYKLFLLSKESFKPISLSPFDSQFIYTVFYIQWRPQAFSFSFISICEWKKGTLTPVETDNYRLNLERRERERERVREREKERDN